MKKELIYNVGDRALAEQIACLLRRAYFRRSSKYAIIGASIDELGAFDSIPGSTTFVLSAIVPFTQPDVFIDVNELLKSDSVRCYDQGEETIYELSYSFQKKHICINDFAPFVKSEKNPTLVDRIEEQTLNIRLYIMQISEIMPESITEALLSELPSRQGIIALAATNTLGNFSFDISKEKGRERLYVTFTAPTEKDVEDVLSNFSDLKNMLTPME